MKIYTVGAKCEGIEKDDFVVIQQGIENKSTAIMLAKKVDIVIDENWAVYVLEIDSKSQKHIKF